MVVSYYLINGSDVIAQVTMYGGKRQTYLCDIEIRCQQT
jgi:hypothetical protein